jgi:hypothetical protein
MLTLTQVQDRLGIKIGGDFIINELKVTPAKQEKRAMFWEDAQFPAICDGLIQHVHGVKTGTKAVAAKAPKKVKESVDDLF